MKTSSLSNNANGCLDCISGQRKKILVATTNPGKIAELKSLLGAGIEWVSLSDFKDMAEIEEDGVTFAEKLEFMKVRAVTVCAKAGIGIKAGHK